MKRSIPHDEIMTLQLQDGEVAREYLRLSLQEDTPEEFIQSLSKVLRAKWGRVAAVAKSTGLNPVSISKIMKGKSAPRFATVMNILRALDVEPWGETKGRKSASELDSYAGSVRVGTGEDA